MSDLAEAARTAELAFTNMGQAADALAEALRAALAEARRLKSERDIATMALVALTASRASSPPPPKGMDVLAAMDEFERWLVEDVGVQRTTAARYRLYVLNEGQRLGSTPQAFQSLDDQSVRRRRNYQYIRTAVRRWREFLAVSGYIPA